MEETHIIPPENTPESTPVPAETHRPGEAYRSRTRPPRRPLMPATTWIVIGAVLTSIALATALIAYSAQTRMATVPDVTEMTRGQAEQALRDAGFTVTVGEQRFSLKPEGTVLEQNPAAGAEVEAGSQVSLVISEGTEELTMPDVIGDGLALASGRLESLGLTVKVETQPSEQPSGTVLSTTPGPGVTVRTGDIVRITVAATRSVDPALLPYKLQGVVIMLDPGAGKAGDADAPLEVARRLRALLEASGAGVVVTRSALDSAAATTADARAKRAGETTPVVLVGLDALETGAAGLAISIPGGGDATMLVSARKLASNLSTGLAQGSSPVPVTVAVADAVQRAVKAPSARIRLGSYTSRDDATDFRDPRWADTMARAIYRAIGETFGAP